jgi:hypothetical protein
MMEIGGDRDSSSMSNPLRLKQVVVAEGSVLLLDLSCIGDQSSTPTIASNIAPISKISTLQRLNNEDLALEYLQRLRHVRWYSS